MKTSVRTVAIVAAATIVGLALHTPAAGAQSAETYQVILYLAEDGKVPEAGIRRLEQIVDPDLAREEIQSIISASRFIELEDIVILPGRDLPAIRVGDITVRVRGVLREPRRESMYLRLEVDGGQEAFVKELVSRFDESIALAYPLVDGNSIVVLLVPIAGVE